MPPKFIRYGASLQAPRYLPAVRSLSPNQKTCYNRIVLTVPSFPKLETKPHRYHPTISPHFPKDTSVKFEHAAINVPDVKAAAQWYVDNLEMRIVIAGQAAPYMTFIADSAGSMIELYTRTDIALPDYSAIDHSNLHFAFAVEDMEATRDALVVSGATVVGQINTTPAGDQLLFLRDPWQVPIQIVKRKKPMI